MESQIISQTNIKTNKKSLFKKSRVIALIILLIITAVMLYPVFLALNMSLLTYKAYLQDSMQIVSAGTFTFDNYIMVFDKLRVLQRFFNTLWMTAMSATLSSLITAIAAFPIARGHFKWSKKIYWFILLSMFFPGSLIANIILLKDILPLYGSPAALILIWSISGIQMNVFMVVGFIKQLPRDLDEAAVIDGCNYFRYILVVAIPLMLPIISTIFTFKAVGCWNDFIGPLIYLRGDTFKTLSVGLYYFKGEYSSKWNQFAAAIVIVATPMVVLYIFMQRYIIEGMTSGALKG